MLHRSCRNALVMFASIAFDCPCFAQQFLDGEKLVDGMLRRVRSAAMQAGRDPDERPGGTLELAFQPMDRAPTVKPNGEWVMDAS